MFFNLCTVKSIYILTDLCYIFVEQKYSLLIVSAYCKTLKHHCLVNDHRPHVYY